MRQAIIYYHYRFLLTAAYTCNSTPLVYYYGLSYDRFGEQGPILSTWITIDTNMDK